MKKQRGVTLITLIVTIIVVLILAGVSLALVMGRRGPISQAKKAAREERAAKAMEAVSIAWSSSMTKFWEEQSKNSLIVMDDYVTKEAIDTYLKEGALLEDPEKDGEDYIVKYKLGTALYEYKIYDNGDIDSLNIGPEKVEKTPELYYGKTVQYSANGITDWKVFYSDGTNMFLITSDYIPQTKVPVAAGMTYTGTHQVFWNPAISIYDGKNIDAELFMAAGYKLNPSNVSSKCVAKLLNTQIWKDFVDVRYAESAIGSPTIEMFVESWNDIYGYYPTQALQYAPLARSQSTEGNGYKIGEESGTLGACISNATMSGKSGYRNTLYYLSTGGANRYGSYGYWLASPASDNDWQIMDINAWGGINRSAYNYTFRSLRPVVALREEAELTLGTNGYDFDLTAN